MTWRQRRPCRGRRLRRCAVRCATVGELSAAAGTATVGASVTTVTVCRAGVGCAVTGAGGAAGALLNSAGLMATRYPKTPAKMASAIAQAAMATRMDPPNPTTPPPLAPHLDVPRKAILASYREGKVKAAKPLGRRVIQLFHAGRARPGRAREWQRASLVDRPRHRPGQHIGGGGADFCQADGSDPPAGGGRSRRRTRGRRRAASEPDGLHAQSRLAPSLPAAWPAPCSRTASVATTASVVFCSARPLVREPSAPAGTGGGKPWPPNSASRSNGAAQNHGPLPTVTLPPALTATSAPIVMLPTRAPRPSRCRP